MKGHITCNLESFGTSNLHRGYGKGLPNGN